MGGTGEYRLSCGSDVSRGWGIAGLGSRLTAGIAAETDRGGSERIVERIAGRGL